MIGASLQLCNNGDGWGELPLSERLDGKLIMKPTAISILAGCAMLVSGAVWSQDVTTTIDEERFVLTEVDGGFVKLDRQLGTVSFCTVISGNIACRLGADERNAYNEAMDQMRGEIEALDKRLAKLESSGPVAKSENSETVPENDTAENPELPVEFDTAMEIAQEAMRRFFSVIQELKKEYEGKTPEPKS